MVVGVLQFDLMIYVSNSLKDKRSVCRRLVADLQHQFLASVAEVEHQDLWNRLGLGVAVAGQDARQVERVLQSIEDHVAEFSEVEIIAAEREIIHV